MTDDLHLLKHIQQATKIGLMRMQSAEDAHHIFEVCSDLTPAQIFKLVKQYSANNPAIVPPSPKFFQAITVGLQPEEDLQNVTIPIIDEVFPFRAPPPRKIDTGMVDLPDDVEAPTVRHIMNII